MFKKENGIMLLVVIAGTMVALAVHQKVVAPRLK